MVGSKATSANDDSSNLLEDRVNGLTTNLKTLTTIVDEAKASLFSQISGNQSSFAAFRDDTQLFRSEAMNWMKVMTEALDSLAGKDELTALQTRVSQWVGGGTLSGPAINASSPVADSTAADIATLTDTFRALRAEVDMLSSNKDSTCVCFGGISAKGPEDTKAWVTLNHNSGEWDILCVDPLILFGLLESHAGDESSAVLKEFNRHQRLHLKNAGEALVVTSTSLERRRVFHKGEPTLVCRRDCSPLSKLGKRCRRNWEPRWDPCKHKYWDVSRDSPRFTTWPTRR
mgnify:CR=1 FL=1